MIGQVWDICLFLDFLEPGQWMGSNTIQSGGQVVPQRKMRVLLPEEERKGYWEGKKWHTSITFPLLFYFTFEIYEKNGPFYNNNPLNYMEKVIYIVDWAVCKVVEETMI